MHAIKCSRLGKMLGGKPILENVSFEVGEGDIFGYLGPNGAGKTTTIRLLLGLLPRTFGELAILGNNKPGVPDLQRQIGFVLDADGLYENLSAVDNLAYYGELYAISNIRNRCAEVLELTGLADRAAERVKVYSTGMRQRLALARAILHRPRLLILDEPTSGVDPSGQAEVSALIQALARQGTTVFLSSHNLDEVQRICNRIAFINKGRIKLSGETARLMAGPQQRIVINLAAPPSAAVLAKLDELKVANGNALEGSQIHLTLNGGATTAEVISQLVAAGTQIDGVKQEEQTLAQLYASVMQEDA